MLFMLFMVKKIRPPAAGKTHHRTLRPAEKEKDKGLKIKGLRGGVSVLMQTNWRSTST